MRDPLTKACVLLCGSLVQGLCTFPARRTLWFAASSWPPVLVSVRALLSLRHHFLEVGNWPRVVFPRAELQPSIVRRPPVGSAQRITSERGGCDVIYGEAQWRVCGGVVDVAFAPTA